jgi:hypothetical protein
VSAKFIPVAIGIVNEKGAEDKALNITNADEKISMKAIITCKFIRNPIQSFTPSKPNPFNLSFMIAAPETLRIE